MKIYVLTKGEYSDYHIVTATTDFELAKEIASKFEAEIEEYDNAELTLKPLWYVRFRENGDVDCCRRDDTNEFGYQEAGVCSWYYRDKVYVYVAADNQEAAIKAGAERRAKFLAEHAGL